MTSMTTFSTIPYAPAERVEVWTEHVKATLFDVLITDFHPLGLEIEVLDRCVGGMQAMLFRGNEHSLERGPERVARARSQSVFVSILLAGGAVYYQPGAIHTLQAGDALVYDPDMPYLLAFQPMTSQLFLRLSTDEFEARLGRRTPVRAEKVTRGSVIDINEIRRIGGDLLRASASELLLHADLDAIVRAVCIPANDNRARLYADAVAFIQSNAADSSVTADVIARYVHSSLRNLNRVFAEHSDTVSRQLTRTRVLAASALLASGSTMQQAAADSGFGSVVTLRRNLRRSRLGTDVAMLGDHGGASSSALPEGRID